jgi:hypothetical protein
LGVPAPRPSAACDCWRCWRAKAGSFHWQIWPQGWICPKPLCTGCAPSCRRRVSWPVNWTGAVTAWPHHAPDHRHIQVVQVSVMSLRTERIYRPCRNTAGCLAGQSDSALAANYTDCGECDSQ